VSDIFIMLRIMLIVCLLFCQLCKATHFRGGTISWTRTNATSRIVKFRVIMHFFTGGIFPRVADLTINYGDGTSNTPSSSTTFLNGTFDASGTIRTISYNDTHTYAAMIAYTAYIQSSARQHAITNGPDASYR
jgi:hypothetical protein